jgi:DNA-binding response OmpR family regulator
MGKPIALIVAASRLLESLRLAVCDGGFDVVETGYADAADRVAGRRPTVAFVACDADRPHVGLDAVRRMREFDADLPIVLLAEASSEDLAIAAIKAGVTDYFKVPFEVIEIVSSLHALVRAVSPAPSSRSAAGTSRRFPTKSSTSSRTSPAGSPSGSRSAVC